VNGATPKGKAEVPALVGVEKMVDFRLADLPFLYFSFGQIIENGGWHFSGYAVCHDNRPADLILFCTRNESGEWVAQTTATPLTAPQYLRDGTRFDFEFLGIQSPQDPQLGAWEADLPPGVFGPEEVGTVSAWALDFSRRNLYYRLEGDHELYAQSAMSERKLPPQ
jgi:hypothetical protein